MRPFGTLVLAAVTIGLNAAPATAQLKPDFGSFRADASPTRHGPRINVDFGQGLPRPFVTPRAEAPLPALQPTVSITVTQAAAPAIDCDMVRQAPANIDPQLVRRPTPGVRHTMRVIPVAPCPAK